MPEKLYQIVKYVYGVACVSFIFSCANIVAPSGGPKDRTPPKVTKCEPANRSAGFSGDKIRITFNEYVFLDDQAGQIVVSPPADKPLEYNISRKSIIISLPENLKDSVTYSVNFGESIKDITENNPLSAYEFAFSKSGVVDSFSIQGQVYDALTRDPQKGILVMLYTSDDDSVPVKSKPSYITKTNAEGKFFLKNIKRKKYKIFALRDMNADMLFNQPSEFIAFADSMITPQYVAEKTGTGPALMDTSAVARDTLIKPEAIRSTTLYVFLQPDTNQKLLKARADTYRQFRLYFKYPARDLMFKVTNRQLPENWKTDDFSYTRDTLTCWLSDPDMDTLKFILSDNGTILDTVEMALKQKPDEQKMIKKPTGKGVEGDPEINKLLLRSNASASTLLPYFLPVRLILSRPVAITEPSKISLYQIIDSTLHELRPQSFFSDTGVKKVYNLEYQWEPAKTYKLVVLPGAFTDIYGIVNDSLLVKFSVNSPETYGRLLFTFKAGESNKSYIIQLLKEDKSLVEQKKSIPGQQIIFENLSPASYRIRIVQDENNNGKWDEGDYFQKRQPEPVFYFPELINIRANWDTEYEFVL
ncbi:MAG TPA: Ig-like domain-containing protein [Bacteroidales bacterium]|nr:Ig-like domain-containing protein [Bacteroidales bacterium]